MALFSKQLSLFYRQLSTMLSSGMPILQAFGELLRHTGSGRFKQALIQIHAHMEQGGTMGEACEAFPDFFPEWQAGVIKAGEKSGRLADSLVMIANQLEKNYSDQLKLLVGLSYPGFMLLVALVLVPMMNMGSCGLAGCISSLVVKGGLFAAVAAGVFFLWRGSGSRVKGFAQGLALALPVVGRLVRQFAVTRFIRSLQALTAAGVPVLSGWKLAAAASGNESVKRGLLGALASIEKGGTLADALARTNVVPPYMIGMISSGEKSGSIVKMLDSVALFCEKENDAAIGVLVKTVPLVVYLLVALFIGSMVLSSYNRIFSSYSTLGM